MSTRSVRLAAAGDLHYTATSRGGLRRMFTDLHGAADVLLLCGDLTDHGLPEEADALAEDIRALQVPVVAVLGNHDYEAGHAEVVAGALRAAGAHVLDGDGCTVAGVGFVGVKGFGGGFGRRALGPWGEDAIKRFVQETIDEAMKLECALARAHHKPSVVLLHYSPIEATVEGEPRELWPFLGSSRLEEPIDRYEAIAAFHGHCHHGSLEGHTRGGTPVYNVAMPLLRRENPGRPPLRFVEVHVEA